MSLEQQITIPQWLSLPVSVRNELKRLFSIPRSSGTYVVDSVVESDGHTNADLSNITVEKMQALLKTEEKDFFALLNQVLEQIHDKLEAEAEAAVAVLEKEQEELAKQEQAKAVEAITKVASLASDALQNVSRETIKKPIGRPKGSKNKVTV